MEQSGKRIAEILDQTARAWGDQPALKVKRDGLWQTTTWREYRDKARLFARGLLSLSIPRGSGIAIIGQNCPQWFFADIGSILASCVPAGIYSTSTAAQCSFIADHCEAPLVVVDDAIQLAKFKTIWHELPKLSHVVLMHGHDDDPRVLAWDEFLARGRQVTEADLDTVLAAQKPEDLCTLIYTSGTTGQPKAVMISHDNITWTAQSAMKVLDIDSGAVTLSYLPLSHIAEQIISLYGPMFLGGCVYFAESMEKLGENLREARPHYFLGVPRVWEKIQAKIQIMAAGNGTFKKALSGWARQVGLQGGYAEQRGEPKSLQYGIAKAIVFDNVRQALGLDRCQMQITAAAPIGKDTLEFFLSLGIPIYEVYGMSECTGPATLSVSGRYSTGKAGFCLPDAELKVFADGEIGMRGRHVCMGYYKNPEATREAIDAEGWLHSGDVGTIDHRGFLQITDRKKDLLITAGGENVAPQLIEAQLKAITAISQAVVIGDRRRYLTALLTLDEEKLPMVAQLLGIDVVGARDHADFARWLQDEVERVNRGLAQVQTIKKFKVLPVDFSVEGGELTPTMKIKRKVIATRYAAEIEGLYA